MTNNYIFPKIYENQVSTGDKNKTILSTSYSELN